jgi:hypothetical protein
MGDTDWVRGVGGEARISGEAWREAWPRSKRTAVIRRHAHGPVVSLVCRCGQGWRWRRLLLRERLQRRLRGRLRRLQRRLLGLLRVLLLAELLLRCELLLLLHHCASGSDLIRDEPIPLVLLLLQVPLLLLQPQLLGMVSQELLELDLQLRRVKSDGGRQCHGVRRSHGGRCSRTNRSGGPAGRC